jgi:hypothetical protein
VKVGRLAWTVLPALFISPALFGNGDAGAEPGFRVATRVPRPTIMAGESGRSTGITLSDGWGCAAFDSEQGWITQCWDAGPKPRAFAVSWIRGPQFFAWDRVCRRDEATLTFQCWHRPRRGDLGVREMPASWQWLNPNGAKRDDGLDRSDRLQDAFMGETFACLRLSKSDRLFCLGDDRFGQLGSSKPPPPKENDDDLAAVRGAGPNVMSPAMGSWHACGLLGLPEQSLVMCWGRGDYGQLGAPAPDKCLVDGESVPCARTLVDGPLVRSPARLALGDMFTCVATPAGIKCWGANRDGLFGKRGSCPEKLRRAWPTPAGPVPAPNASCTSTPVALPGVGEFDLYFTVKPREICYTSGGRQRCLTAVPKPSDKTIERYTVNPGSDANACAKRGDGVVCWGEKYSPRSAPGKPVTIAFEPLPPLGDLAVIDDDPTLESTKRDCQIRRQCPLVKKLPPCNGGEKPRSASAVLAAAPSLEGQIVLVRGPLGVGEPYHGAVGDLVFVSCDRNVRCCDKAGAPVIIAAGGGTLAVDGLFCSGDESRACCNAPAFGQTVVATGRLKRDSGEIGLPAGSWRLVDARVCEEVAPPPGPNSP